MCLFVYLWWAIYRESRGIIVLESLEIDRVNLFKSKISLAARLESAFTKLGIAGNVDLLIRFGSFQITERSPLIFLLILGESRDHGKQLSNLISDLI